MEITVNHEELVRTILGIISVALVTFVLTLSVTHTAAKAHLGPKIFVVNLMSMDLIHTVCGLYSSIQWGFGLEFQVWLWSLFGDDAAANISGILSFLDRLTLTAFTCSMIPMTTMSVMACYRPKAFTGKTAAKYFAVLVVAADLIPLLFSAICVALIDFRSPSNFTGFYGIVSRANTLIRTTQYSVLYFAMYFGDMALTVVALRTLYTKTGQLATEHAGRSAARKNLRHLVMFSIAPGLIQIPYALFQFSSIIVGDTLEPAAFWFRFNMSTFAGVRYVFTLKPSIDAISTLLFIGEYRRNGTAVLKRLRWCCEEVLPSTQATVDHMPNSHGGSTVTPMPSSNSFMR